MLESKEIAARIKAAAKVKNIKLGKMWHDLGLSNNTLHNMNNGSTPSTGTLLLISQYLGIPVEYLTGEKIALRDTEGEIKKLQEYNDLLCKMTIAELLNLLDNLTKELQKRQHSQAE